MLLHEERASRVRDLPLAPIPTQPTLSRRRAETLPSRPAVDESTPHRVPLIWARGGLTSAWIREIISSDALFIKGERERYDLARTVVELRRRQGIDDDEEKDWVIMFRNGIYYTNMVPCPPYVLHALLTCPLARRRYYCNLTGHISNNGSIVCTYICFARCSLDTIIASLSHNRETTKLVTCIEPIASKRQGTRALRYHYRNSLTTFTLAQAAVLLKRERQGLLSYCSGFIITHRRQQWHRRRIHGSAI